MGDWDDEETDFVAKKIDGSWDDDLGDVPDAWDAEPKEVKSKATPAPEKLSLAERIKIKEEKKRKEKEEKLKREEELRSEQSMSELQREKLAEEAELGLLEDTFGNAPTQPEFKDTIDNIFNVNTKDDFNKLNMTLKEKLISLEKSPHFSEFAEALIRDTIVGMDVETLKSVNTAISALVAEKQKLIKGKVKKKSKGKLMVEREHDYTFQEDSVVPDEYDDFI